jgi:hypothetical protein
MSGQKSLDHLDLLQMQRWMTGWKPVPPFGNWVKLSQTWSNRSFAIGPAAAGLADTAAPRGAVRRRSATQGLAGFSFPWAEAARLPSPSRSTTNSQSAPVIPPIGPESSCHKVAPRQIPNPQADRPMGAPGHTNNIGMHGAPPKGGGKNYCWFGAPAINFAHVTNRA